MDIDDHKNDYKLKINFFRSFVTIDRTNWIPKIYIHKKFEKHIQYTIYICIAISFLLSFIELFFLIPLSISLLLFFLKNILFKYTQLVVTSFPFDFDPVYWKLNIFCVNLNDKGIIIVFNDEKQRDYLFNTLMDWNYSSYFDNDNNIIFSIIEYEAKGNREYKIFLTPNPERAGVKNAFDFLDAITPIEAKIDNKKRLMKRDKLVFQFSLFKVNTNSGGLDKFKLCKMMGDDNFWISMIVTKEDLSTNLKQQIFLQKLDIKKLEKIHKKHIRILHKRDLKKDDIEYIMAKAMDTKEIL